MLLEAETDLTDWCPREPVDLSKLKKTTTIIWEPTARGPSGGVTGVTVGEITQRYFDALSEAMRKLDIGAMLRDILEYRHFCELYGTFQRMTLPTGVKENS